MNVFQGCRVKQSEVGGRTVPEQITTLLTKAVGEGGENQAEEANCTTKSSHPGDKS